MTQNLCSAHASLLSTCEGTSTTPTQVNIVTPVTSLCNLFPPCLSLSTHFVGDHLIAPHPAGVASSSENAGAVSECVTSQRHTIQSLHVRRTAVTAARELALAFAADRQQWSADNQTSFTRHTGISVAHDNAHQPVVISVEDLCLIGHDSPTQCSPNALQLSAPAVDLSCHDPGLGIKMNPILLDDLDLLHVRTFE